MNHIPSGADDVQGWGGGQYDLYENGANSLLILGTTWDTGDAAVRFDSALRQSLLRYPKSGDTWSDGTRYFTTLAKRDRVFIIAGTDRASVLKAPSAIK